MKYCQGREIYLPWHDIDSDINVAVFPCTRLWKTRVRVARAGPGVIHWVLFSASLQHASTLIYIVSGLTY
jgi:hypothetical protein